MRRQSREIALQILFQTEFTPKLSRSEFVAVHEQEFDRETLDYAEDLIDGVIEHKADIDSKIQAASRHWKIERMAGVDRNMLRIAVFEMKFAANPIKENIIIDEAIEIAKKFGTTDSGAFVNGVLDQIAKGS
ncbi:MAG: transcription antitermination factor NusB [Bdellovibrionaceae bacterium]|nr:transcription antitermination factor NusB [Pseudobdellovibrionaceae bacterium]MBX3033117.1 transcription antitermination factor NusB [Pseudobdellovibrionaceae bacterium]